MYYLVSYRRLLVITKMQKGDKVLSPMEQEEKRKARVKKQIKAILKVSFSQLDALIAAHAKSKELILVSNHIRDFARVDGLIVEDWG